MKDHAMGSGALSRSLVLIMAAASGLAAANLYYNQPLLVQIARSFSVPEHQVGILPSLAQMGYALGLFLLVPLGDILERRRLIVALFALVSVFLLGAALAPSLSLLAVATFAIGMTTVMAQILIPFAAHLVAPEERGKVIGSIMSGLLIGILLSRTVSGFVGERSCWRVMYVLAAGIMLLFAVVMRCLLPPGRNTTPMSYASLLTSLFALFREQPVLREAAFSGALIFAAFSAFWSTLVLLLASPAYHLGAQAAGLFGLVGAAGALASPLAGRLVDTRSPRSLLQLATVIILVAYLIFWVWGLHLAGLVIGVILMDVGVQMGHVSNQTRVFSLLPGAQSRLNTVYMVAYFCGGSIGSYLGAWGWQLAQWHGVCLVGLSLTGLLTLYFMLTRAIAT